MARLIEKVKALRNQPEAHIKTGKVFVNGVKVEDPNHKLSPTDKVVIKATSHYVSRAAYKLIAALNQFNLDLSGKAVLDIGASTGGFTQVALEHNARRVYALDVGTNQLDYRLRTNDRVVVFEKTHLKKITTAMFPELIDFVLVDVSFISVRRVFDVLASFPPLRVVVLIKPQFEAFRDEVLPGGHVTKLIAQKVISRITSYALMRGFRMVTYASSPLKGLKAGNTEYISLFIKE